jgi:predicted dithiol-disulfide oxidoreductase (DUF899 family)
MGRGAGMMESITIDINEPDEVKKAKFARLRSNHEDEVRKYKRLLSRYEIAWKLLEDVETGRRENWHEWQREVIDFINEPFDLEG